MKNVSKLIAFKNESGVSLKCCKNKIYDELAGFNNWKNGDDIICFIAYLPFLRNLVELESSDSNEVNENYQLITKFLHYTESTEKLEIKSLSMLFKKNGFRKRIETITSEKKYWKILMEETNKIIDKQLDETDLKQKIILSIYIRLNIEKFLLEKFHELLPDNDALEHRNGRTDYRKIFTEIKSMLENKECSLVQSSFIICPSFIHVNSFMYEPLVDIGTERLVDMVNKIKDL